MVQRRLFKGEAKLTGLGPPQSTQKGQGRSQEWQLKDRFTMEAGQLMNATLLVALRRNWTGY